MNFMEMVVNFTVYCCKIKNTRIFKGNKSNYNLLKNVVPGFWLYANNPLSIQVWNLWLFQNPFQDLSSGLLISLLLWPQVAPRSSKQYMTTKLGCVWHKWKISVEIPTWDNSWRRTSVIIIFFSSKWLLDYQPKVKPLHWALSIWHNFSSCCCGLLSSLGLGLWPS